MALAHQNGENRGEIISMRRNEISREWQGKSFIGPIEIEARERLTHGSLKVIALLACGSEILTAQTTNISMLISGVALSWRGEGGNGCARIINGDFVAGR